MRVSIPLVCLGIAGCFGPQSQVQSTDSIVVTGTAQRNDGTPEPSSSVTLIRHPDLGQILGDAFVTIATLGLACLNGQNDLCHPFEVSPTDAGGGFSFAMRGADTQGSAGEALLFTAVLTGSTPANAIRPAGVSVDFYIQRTRFSMPVLRLWEKTGNEDDSNGPHFTWPALDSTIGNADGYRLVVTANNGQVAWSQATTSTSTSFDARVTQDFAGSWAVSAHHKVSASPTDWDFTHYSPGLVYSSKGHLPLSRGKDCYVQSASGPLKQSPCPLTDGDLSTRFQAAPPVQCPQSQMCTPPPQNGWVYVDLGSPQSLSLLVLYDVLASSTAPLAVEGSSDASTWTALGATDLSSYHTMALSGSARYVRLRVTGGEFSPAGNSEIAIY